MKIFHTTPPNYPQLCAAFPALINNPYAIFAYGDTIFYPVGDQLPPYKIAHEEVHGAQQHSVGVEYWWDMYIYDKEFRLDEEIPAHHADYIAFCKEFKDKNEQHRYLAHLANQLASKLYGNIISPLGALTRIRHGK